MYPEFYKQLFYFDIETVGKYKNLTDYKNNDEEGYINFINKCKRKELQNKINVNPELEYLEKSPLYSEYGKIVCFSFGVFKNDKFITKSYTGEEEDILNNIKMVFDRIDISTKLTHICGFNVKFFDIPWINKKLMKYNISLPPNLVTLNRKPWETNIIDLSDVWKNYGFDTASLGEVTYELNIKSSKKVLSGDKIHEFYWETNDIDSIVTYCEDDIRAIMEISKKILHLAYGRNIYSEEKTI